MSKFDIANIQGKEVERETCSVNNRLSLNAGDLSQGIYVLEIIIADNLKGEQKVLVQP